MNSPFGINFRWNWRPIAYIFLINLALLLILGMIMDGIVMPIITRHGEELAAPSVIGLDVEEAKQALTEGGFGWVIAGEEFSPTKPQFTVLLQQPAPGLRVKKGRTIGLIISKGGETKTIPELRGLTLRQAKLMLEEDDFLLGSITYDFDRLLPPDVIIRSSPLSGLQVNRGSTVDLVVNGREGKILIMVPDYIGMDFTSVKARISEIGLILGDVEYIRNDSVLPETILSQSLVAGMEVLEGTKISFTVSQTEGH